MVWRGRVAVRPAAPLQVCDSERTSLESSTGTLRYRVNETAHAASANASGSCAGSAVVGTVDAGKCIKVIQAAPYFHVALALTFLDGNAPGAAGGPQIFDVASVPPTHPDAAWLLEEADLASWRLWPSDDAARSAVAIVSTNYMVRAGRPPCAVSLVNSDT